MSKTQELKNKKLPTPEKSSPQASPSGDKRRFYLKLRSPVHNFQPMGNEAIVNNGMHAPGVGPQPQVMVPNYSMFTGTPSYVASMKVRSTVPSFLAENELKLEILKRQHICQAQVRHVIFFHN